MAMQTAGPNVSTLASRSWALMIRGIAAILFGALALTAPGIGLMFLLFLWASYAIIDGVLALMLAARGRGEGRRWGWLALEGVIGIAAGVFSFAWPRMTALMLLTVIAIWAVATGIAEIIVAIRIRREVVGEWMLALSGVLSIAIGVLMLVFPGAGALGIVTVIGAYAIIFGGLFIGLGVRLNRWSRATERHLPTGGSATPA